MVLYLLLGARVIGHEQRHISKCIFVVAVVVDDDFIVVEVPLTKARGDREP
jgi:hypothetical protein